MNFLAPLFLVGALAIAAPIIFHLIRRTPMLQRPFSSLMFLTPSPPRLSKRSRLDKILLLLLRCLIIGLLALAFARPFLRDKLPVPTANAPAKISLVLIDASASMRRQNLWAEATARAKDFVRKASPADRVEVALFDRGVRKLVSFDEWSALQLQERVVASERRIAEAAPTWFTGELGSALIFGAEELDALAQLHPSTMRQIVVISDLEEGSHVQNLQGFDWPKGVEVIFQTVRAKSRNNAGLHIAVEGETVSPAVADVRPLVRVSNASESKREQFRLAWVDSKSGAVLGNAIDVHVVAGKSRVVRAPQRTQTNAEFHLVLTGDDEAFDNTLYLAAPEPERVQVAFVGAGAENDPEDLFYYLKRAFQETRRRTVSIAPSPAVSPGARFVITSGKLAEADSLRKHLEQGGSALFVMKDVASAPALEQLVKANGAVSEATVREYAMLEQIDFAHPIFAPFSEPRFSDFTKIHFWKHRRVETNGWPQARVIARFDDGSPALLETDVGKGKLLVLTTGWHPADSQLALSSKFVPLLYSMLEYAGCFKEHVSLLLSGNELPVREASMSLQRPDGSAVQPASGRWILDAPGLFKASEASGSYNLAVNLDPAESKTAPLDVSELQKLGVPVQATAVSAAAVEKEQKWTHATELEARQKLWRWLIIAALAFVLVEIWFAARVSRPVAVEA